MSDILLPPDLDRFAVEMVESGRYPDKAAVASAGLELLRRQETLRAEFRQSVRMAEEEADRDGWVSGDELLERMEAVIARKFPSAA